MLLRGNPHRHKTIALPRKDAYGVDGKGKGIDQFFTLKGLVTQALPKPVTATLISQCVKEHNCLQREQNGYMCG